jgi:hypothetical protein
MRRTPTQAVDQATTELKAAVEALRDSTTPMPADLGDVFGALGEHLRRLDHLTSTLASSYDRLPAELRCDNGDDPSSTMNMLLLRVKDIRMHLDRADQALQDAHNLAARIALV